MFLCTGGFLVDASTSSLDESPIEEANPSGLECSVSEAMEDVFLWILRCLVAGPTRSLDESPIEEDNPS